MKAIGRPYTVHITEVATGETRVHHENGEFLDFAWVEGNYSCDCNRALFFARAQGGPDPDAPCGEGAFLVRIVGDATGTVLLDETQR